MEEVDPSLEETVRKEGQADNIKVEKSHMQSTQSSMVSNPMGPYLIKERKKGYRTVRQNQFQLPEQMCKFELEEKRWERKKIPVTKRPTNHRQIS